MNNKKMNNYRLNNNKKYRFKMNNKIRIKIIYKQIYNNLI